MRGKNRINVSDGCTAIGLQLRLQVKPPRIFNI